MTATRIRNRTHPLVTALSGYQFDTPILVVEDQKSTAEYTAALIRDRWNCEVHIADSLQAARLALGSTTPAIKVAICDLNLPDAPYGEVIDLMNEYGVAAIALTGAYGEELRSSLSKKGVVDFIPKGSVNAYEYTVGLAGKVQENYHTSILVVDDSLSARALYKHMCELLRFKVFTATNGKQALEVLEAHPEISLMLTDFAMPVMDGYALTANARAKYSKDKLAIIGISGGADEEISSNFLKCGANDYLAKPFSYQEFLCRIHQNLDMLANRDAAQRDFMTGLYNRRYFFEAGARIYHQPPAKGLVAGMIDLDFFKKINDNYGHDCGDQVIRHFASLLKDYFAEHLVARIGGEEFAVLLEDSDQVRDLFEALRSAVNRSCIDFGEHKISYTISVGLSGKLGTNIDDLIKNADIALYQAKHNNRDQVVGPDSPE
jgi:diguanylate cyclase (GGDEF)-like protein